ncbi:uncharacterized protein LTR77_011124 [Saxophila tyrrhenica]|uniref:Potassium channel domain-containing protein n=1 Tax=Saxophila tyrrhenica TaxID=1690608 RepID=A0AAV9NUE0_9PEZI|nr:hypothetical protein LTR77_011124 [Saxophila tyrrhenica]
MASNKKPWVFLPFLGGSSKNPERDIARGQNGARAEKTKDVVDPALAMQATVDDFANMDEEAIVQDYNSPIHMWVIATLFPLTAGTFGPMASMFNICAIAIPWRLIVNPESTQSNGTHIGDPKWLVGVNIVSLVIAILANLSLLGQMTNRLRYNVSGPITIIGFFISGFVDIALVGAAESHLKLPDTPNATYSQAFYYAAISGAIYVILAMMLSVTAYGIWFGRYSTEFKLSMSQRSLMLQTILLLTYILAGGGVYSVIEKWSYLDSTYFSVVTIFTIGFGDFTPATHLGRSLFFPFAVGGILFVGVIIANIRTLVLESGSVKVSTRLVEKARFKSIKAGNPDEGILRLRGVKKRDCNADTELERREKEFLIMREIQAEAAQNNRLFSLIFSSIAFMILWFIGAVVFWQAESKSVGGEDWTYFSSLYFTFVAQLTIGYGELAPQTNSAKPAFVFWALIALPTLTVLVGAIGDTVSAFVNWYTTWIGNHTVNFWRIFRAPFTSSNPKSAIKSAARDMREDREKSKAAENGGAEADNGFRQIAHLEQQSTVPHGFDLSGLTEMEAAVAEETYKPFIILKASQKILEHLDASPPRKYSFQEWTWLLKLLGEDETDERGHRRVGQELPEGAEVVSPVRTHGSQMWSWLGQESPLMSLEEDSEPKWVLKRLMWALERELKERAERHIERDIGAECLPGGSSGSSKEGEASGSSKDGEMSEKGGQGQGQHDTVDFAK